MRMSLNWTLSDLYIFYSITLNSVEFHMLKGIKQKELWKSVKVTIEESKKIPQTAII